MQYADGSWRLNDSPQWEWWSINYRIKQPVDPYAELKAAAADTTKQMRIKNCNAWQDAGYPWSWNLPADKYEIRDKLKKVKLLAWFDGVNLLWRAEECPLLETLWKRVPSEDKVVEVEE